MRQWSLNLILISLVKCKVNSHEKESDIRKNDVDQDHRKGEVITDVAQVVKIFRGFELTCWKIVLSQAHLSVRSDIL